MKTLVVAALTLMMSLGVAAAAPADFSGSWVLNASKSKNLGMMATMDYASDIQQTADALSVKDTTQMMGQAQTQETHYLLNGTPTPNVSYMGDQAQTTTRWDGAKVVTTWTSPGAVAGTNSIRTETRSLSADGNTMTVESTNGSKAPIVFAFDRK